MQSRRKCNVFLVTGISSTGIGAVKCKLSIWEITRKWVRIEGKSAKMKPEMIPLKKSMSIGPEGHRDDSQRREDFEKQARHIPWEWANSQQVQEKTNSRVVTAVPVMEAEKTLEVVLSRTYHDSQNKADETGCKFRQESGNPRHCGQQVWGGGTLVEGLEVIFRRIQCESHSREEFAREYLESIHVQILLTGKEISFPRSVTGVSSIPQNILSREISAIGRKPEAWLSQT